jgi:hypothetical protein
LAAVRVFGRAVRRVIGRQQILEGIVSKLASILSIGVPAGRENTKTSATYSVLPWFCTLPGARPNGGRLSCLRVWGRCLS